MRRRVALAVIVSVVAALVLAGVGTLVLSRVASRRSAERQLQDQAGAIADLVGALGTGKDAVAQPPRLSVAALRRIASAMPHRDGDVQDIGLVVIGPGGRAFGELPDGLVLSEHDDAIVQQGGQTSGSTRGGRIYGVAGRAVGASTVIVGVSGTTRALFSGAATWFLLSSVLVVALAAGLAWWLGSRLARPVRDATSVTRRIAGGDLTARLPEPRPEDTDETAVLARSVNAMADALARSRGLEQQFLMSVSHDLRTPLTNIRGYAEAISDGATSPESGAEVIRRESDRLDRLVRDLLDLARLDARQFTLHLRPIDLGAVVRDAAESHRAELVAAGLSLSVRSDESVTVSADADRLAQVVGNLVGNATRYAERAVVVTTSAEPTAPGTDPNVATGGAAVVQVWNDGTPIATADLPYVFERLYQGHDQPSRTESGSGLGLAIVRELVAAMGGEVGVLTPPVGGTTFWFRLPRMLTP